VLVVDDSPIQRQLLIALLATDPELEVVGWATDGAEAIRTAARVRPNVLTMDLRMPGMDGLEAARRIMRESPVPIVMVTANGAAQDRALVDEALAAGILAVVAKPNVGGDDRRAAAALLRTIKSMASIRVVRRAAPGQPTRSTNPAPRVVAIAASTGGPQVLQQILPALPADFPVPVLVVQHIASGFETGLVELLRPPCALPIELAVAGQPAKAPGIYVAPTGRHLGIRGGLLALTDEPPIGGHRPSATILFRSVAREYGRATVGVLLTGMGNDGAAGLADLKGRGGLTIAQDQASSTVFGMPAAAIDLGVVDQILSPTQIAPLLIELVCRPGAGQ
jgi:two-component system, chemotaxis family, protein-glutamate methylesterase/glutaminase